MTTTTIGPNAALDLDATELEYITPLPPPRNAFASPHPASLASSTSYQPPGNPKYFRSRRVKKDEVERPWLAKKDPREKWVTIIPLVGVAIGLAIAGFLIYDGLRTVQNHTHCPVLLEDFSSGDLNPKFWTKEVEVGGFG